MRPRPPTVLAILAILTVLAGTVAAQPSYDWSGRLEFHEPVLIGPGETLRVAPGTVVTGSASIEVRGALRLEGTADRPISLALPVLLVGPGNSTFTHVRWWGVNDTALDVRAGAAELDHVAFEANGRAIRVSARGSVVARDATFRGHAGEALYAEGGARVLLERANVTQNGVGLAVYSASQLDVRDSTFSENGQHLLLGLGPWSEEGSYALSGNSFGKTAALAAPLPGVHLRHDGSLGAAGTPRVVRLSGDRFADAPTGLRVEGAGLAVESVNDTFVGNAVGVSVQLAQVTLRHPTFGNAQDVDGRGVTILDPVYLGAAAAPLTLAEPPPTTWLAWAVGVALALVALLGVAAALRHARRRPTLRVPVTAREREAGSDAASDAPGSLDPAVPAGAVPPPEGEADAARAGGPDLATPITSLERRILEDIVAHPGTSQRAVADRLGYTRQALHYHVKRLEARGLVSKAVEGRETRCSVPAEVARHLSTPAVTQTGSQEKG